MRPGVAVKADVAMGAGDATKGGDVARRRPPAALVMSAMTCVKG